MNIPDSLDKLHQAAGAQLSYQDRLGIPQAYPEGLQAEVAALQSQCGLFDRKGWLLLELKGPDAARFLQGMVTMDVEKLPVGQLQPTLICQSKGKIQHALELWHLDDQRWLLSCEPGDGLQVGNHLHKYHIREDFEFALVTPSQLRLDLRGPLAQACLEGLGYPEETPSHWSWEGTQIQITRLQRLGVPCFALLLPGEQAAPFAQALLQGSRCQWVGWQAWQEQDLLEQRPVFGRDFTTDHFAQEVGLAEYISYSKGCYIGQEPNARLYHRGRPQRQLVQVQLPPDQSIQPGQALYLENEEVGHITAAAQSIIAETRPGLALLRTRVLEQNIPYLSLEAEGAPALVTWSLLPTHIQR